jgi:hypothetical protein
MGKLYEGIDGRLRDFVEAQHVFFVGTAPSGSDGHINVSPKGMAGTFAVLDARRVAYLDFTGSGAETIAHLRDNGRIIIMFCAFEGPPKIVRMHGRGEAIPVTDPRCAGLLGAFPSPPTLHGLRSVIVVDVTRISDSCGYGVPMLAYAEDRDVLLRSYERRSADNLADYRATRNIESIDGLPALPARS